MFGLCEVVNGSSGSVEPVNTGYRTCVKIATGRPTVVYRLAVKHTPPNPPSLRHSDFELTQPSGQHGGVSLFLPRGADGASLPEAL